MLEKLRENLRSGLRKIKWFATVFSERVNIEIAVFKLLHRSNEMDEKRKELLMTIGRRVYDLKQNPEKNILKDRTVVEAVDEIERIERNIEELKHTAAELSKAGV